MLSKAYLIAYNAVVAAGWAWIMVMTLSSLRLPASENAKCTFYNTVCFDTSSGPAIFDFLKIFQTAACLEVLHVMLGLVKGTLFTTFFQVFSREVLTWFVCYVSPRITQSDAFFLMMVAWSVTEVIRYNLYWIKLAFDKVPYPLMWCRYSFFIVLYPLGVYSEILCNLRAIFFFNELREEGKFLDDTEENGYVARLSRQYGVCVALLMVLYPTVFPQMYLYMFKQRSKYLNARKPRPQQTEGIQFPADDKGKRSTSAFNQAAFAASVFNHDQQAAMAVMKEKNWRFGYGKHVIRNVALSCKDNDTCLKTQTLTLVSRLQGVGLRSVGPNSCQNEDAKQQREDHGCHAQPGAWGGFREVCRCIHT
ncbi:hypothetical protein PTSG_07138 [Salpingoeca rosetta]|uniref:very-long-chain (3R)-3-hydroxyacyl-CoA dehydratase n=1 Tax=Salpingoeca rosetta (strain ATCC 50818 / BSB-021) TaxID=946362 RepID=F2UE60_SALR5|nr:uncharacterized protein PTSG_07138 [Salpingoeca rosetta]EGD74910.1 hypothetical protein PTSG_07138 [Salpingoeca rosetta]|eukprot:XP_004992555.1 hypothetical protein PTSG_07138 [Salpingoeca rosetta]